MINFSSLLGILDSMYIFFLNKSFFYDRLLCLYLIIVLSYIYLNILRHKNFKHKSTKIAGGTILRVRIISNLGNNTDWISKKCSGVLSRFHEQFIVLVQWLQDSVGDVLHSIYGDKGMDKFFV